MGFAATWVTGSDSDGRTAERAVLRLRSGFRQRGRHGTGADLLDLSTHGFRVEAPVMLAKGDQVWVSIAGFEAKAARVVWVEGGQAGCEFDSPFHPSVFERIVALGDQGDTAR